MVENSNQENNKPTTPFWRRYLPIWFLFLILFVLLYLSLPFAKQQFWHDMVRVLLIFVGGLLPLIIYNYFVQGRLPTFLKEYKQNLRRLGLPENASQYQEKFDAVYGAASLENRMPLLNSPIFIATVLSTIGWGLVFIPTTVGPLVPNPTPIAYGFLGAYTFGLGSLVRQYATDDLQVRYYASLTMRYLTIFVLSWLLMLVMPEETAENTLLIAFFIGLFPAFGLRIIQRAATSVLGVAYDGFQEPLPLSHLDGLNAYHEDRLLLEGIENMQNLVAVNIVDLMLKTRFPVEQIVDWMDQSLLKIHVRERYAQFQSSGIRTATDFLVAYEAKDRPATEVITWRQQLADHINSQPSDDKVPATTLALLDTIAYAIDQDPNLFHLQYWRTHEYEALPEDIDNRRTQADMKLMQNLPDEAIPEYDSLLRDFPNYMTALLYRGLAYATKGDYLKAIDDYTDLIERIGDYPEEARQAYLYRGRAWLALGDFENAMRSYEEAIGLLTFPEARLDLAVLQMTYRQAYTEAIANLDRVIASKFNEAEALANRGLARYERVRWGQLAPDGDKVAEMQLARQDLERALRLKPTLIPFYINLAHLLGEWGELPEKELTLNQALAQLEATPNEQYLYRVRLERGYLYLKQERYDEALTDFQIATQLEPEQATGFYFLGMVQDRRRELATAVEVLRRAVIIAPDFIRCHEELGEVLMKMEDYEAAAMTYATVLRLAREAEDTAVQARTHGYLGRAYRQLQRLPDAIRELQNSMAVAQAKQEVIYTQACYELGCVYLAMGETALASTHFRNSAVLFEVMGLKRESARAYRYLGEVYIKETRMDEARQVLATAVEQLNPVFIPDNPQDQALQTAIQQALAQIDSL